MRTARNGTDPGEQLIGDERRRRPSGRHVDRVHARRKGILILQLRPQHLFRKYRVRGFEYAAQEALGEQGRDAVSQPAGQYFLAVAFEVVQFLQEPVLDQKPRIALLDPYAAPDFGHEHADVVIHSVFRADIARRRGESRIAGKDGGDHGVVQVHNRGQRIERPFR